MIGRVLGLDYGERRVGVAVSDALQTVATPVSTLHHTAWKQLWPPLADLEKEYQPVAWVIGLPLHMTGEAGERVDKTNAFIEAFREHTRIDIVTWDERLTTAEAQRAMHEMGVKQERRKQLVDQLAAQLVLQSWLDARAFQADASFEF